MWTILHSRYCMEFFETIEEVWAFVDGFGIDCFTLHYHKEGALVGAILK